MNRRIAQTTIGVMVALLLVACGGGGGSDANKTATARTADANDAATVTAFAGGSQNTGNTGSGTRTATGAAANGGNGGFFRFATLPAGNASGPSATAVGTARGTTAAGTGRAGTPAGVAGNMYTDPQGRYSFTIPQGWRIQQPSDTTIDIQAAPPSSLQGILQIASDSIVTGTSLDDYVNSTMSDLKSGLPNYQTVPNSVQNLTIGGLDARRFDFTGSQSGTNLKGAVFIVRKGQNAYVLLVAAIARDFDTVLAQARITVDSFTLL